MLRWVCCCSRKCFRQVQPGINRLLRNADSCLRDGIGLVPSLHVVPAAIFQPFVDDQSMLNLSQAKSIDLYLLGYHHIVHAASFSHGFDHDEYLLSQGDRNTISLSMLCVASLGQSTTTMFHSTSTISNHNSTTSTHNQHLSSEEERRVHTSIIENNNNNIKSNIQTGS